MQENELSSAIPKMLPLECTHPPVGAQVWDAIYETLYESLNRFPKLLGNGRK